MANNIITSTDGVIWLDVTDKARKIFETELFQLYHVWESDGKTMRIPIVDEIDMEYAETTGHPICIEVGRLSDGELSEKVTSGSWKEADKITHNGYVYVKYNDLTFYK
jgi:hypothetical protein